MSYFQKHLRVSVFFASSREGVEGGADRIEALEKNEADMPKRVEKVGEQMKNAREMGARHEEEHKKIEVPQAEALLNEIEQGGVSEHNGLPEKSTELRHEATKKMEADIGDMMSLLSIENKTSLSKLYARQALLMKSLPHHMEDLQAVNGHIQEIKNSLMELRKSKEQLRISQEPIKNAVANSSKKDIYLEPLKAIFSDETVTEQTKNLHGSLQLLRNLFGADVWSEKISSPSKGAGEKTRAQLVVDTLIERNPGLLTDLDSFHNKTFGEFIESIEGAHRGKILGLDGIGDPNINQLLIRYFEEEKSFRVSQNDSNSKIYGGDKLIIDMIEKKRSDGLSVISDERRRKLYEAYTEQFVNTADEDKKYPKLSSLVDVQAPIAGDKARDLYVRIIADNTLDPEKSKNFRAKLDSNTATLGDLLDLYGGEPRVASLLIPFMPKEEQNMLVWIGNELGARKEERKIDEDLHELRVADEARFQREREQFQEFQKATGLRTAEPQSNISPQQNNSSPVMRSESIASSVSLSELSTSEYKPLQTPSGKEIQAKLDARTGDIIASDPKLKNPVNIGKPREFEANAPILEIGLANQELQSLFYGDRLDLVKKHMKYIENSMNRPTLTIDQYEAFLLTSLVSISHAENAEKYPTTFDATYLPQIKRYFQENRREIMEGLRKQNIASQEYGINPQRFLERLHPNQG